VIDAVGSAVQLENPFPGLRSFTVDESHLFFGRDGQSDELLRKMDRSRFVAVVGVSGSGKSSLVRAGLLPSLFNGYLATAGPEWEIADLRPGSDPFPNLATALSRTRLWNDAITADALRASSLALVGAARESAQWRKGDNLLILVDQFEELFRYHVRRDSEMADRDEKASFVKVLLEAAAHRDLPIYVVITMRSDFLGDCAQFRDLPEAINNGQYLIPRMNREDRRSAVEAPIQVAGGSITPRLVYRILNDTGEDPGQLPVMQHALMRCWNYWCDRAQPGQPMDLEHYEAIGTLTRALSSHADEAYEEACRSLPGRGDEIVKRIFQRLRNRDVNGREIRRPTRFAELCAVAEASRAEMLTVLECFHRDRRTFLVPAPTESMTDDVQIDITHECLLRQWDRMVGWVAEELESQRIYRRLADRAEEPAAPAEGVTPTIDFLRGTPLQLALDWWERRRPTRVWAERYHRGFDAAEAFLRKSQAYRDVQRRAEEEAKQREKQLQVASARREQEAREKELKKRVAYALAGDTTEQSLSCQ
jgi:Novel STAND NTPase 1